jgi:ligand-binding sensor domain-containing protein
MHGTSSGINVCGLHVQRRLQRARNNSRVILPLRVFNTAAHCYCYCYDVVRFGRMWVGTSTGRAYLYNVLTHELEGSFHAVGGMISCMISVNKHIWISTRNELVVYQDSVCLMRSISLFSHSLTVHIVDGAYR